MNNERLASTISNSEKYYCLNCKGTIPIETYVRKNHNQDHLVVISAIHFNYIIERLQDRVLELEDKLEENENE